MKVSLPQLAAHATPAKTLPGAATSSEKFSIALSEAQDTADESMPDVLNSRGSQIAKKLSAKNDKGNPKPSAINSSTALAKQAPSFHAAADPMKATPAISARPSWQNSLSQQIPTDEIDESSGESTVAEFDSNSAAMTSLPNAGSSTSPSAETKSGGMPILRDAPDPIASGQDTKANSKDSAAEGQEPPVSSDPSSMGSVPENLTNFGNLVAAAPAGQQSSATPNGKPAIAGAKSASEDAARDTTSKAESKTQTGFALHPSHDAASTVPLAAANSSMSGHSGSNSETKREELRGHALSGSSTMKTEKGTERTSADVAKDDVDGSAGETAQSGKVNSSTAGMLSGSSNSAVTGPIAGVSTQTSPVAVEGHVGGAVVTAKGSQAPASGQTAVVQEAESTVEAAGALGNPAIHTAKLMAGMEQSELRMGLRTGEFGNVDIRTSLVHNQFTAEISTERGELGRALAAELPSLQHRLTQQHLPAASITVQDHSGGSADFRQGPRSGQSAPPPRTSGTGDRSQQDAPIHVLPLENIETARLDIHM